MPSKNSGGHKVLSKFAEYLDAIGIEIHVHFTNATFRNYLLNVDRKSFLYRKYKKTDIKTDFNTYIFTDWTSLIDPVFDNCDYEKSILLLQDLDYLFFPQGLLSFRIKQKISKFKKILCAGAWLRKIVLETNDNPDLKVDHYDLFPLLDQLNKDEINTSDKKFDIFAYIRNDTDRRGSDYLSEVLSKLHEKIPSLTSVTVGKKVNNNRSKNFKQLSSTKYNKLLSESKI